MKKIISTLAALFIFICPALAQTSQIPINKLPVPSSGSTYLSTGDIVPANRNGVTYQMYTYLGSASQYPIGTSGASLGLLNTNNTNSGNDTFTGGVLVGSATGGMPSSGYINAQGLLINNVPVGTLTSQNCVNVKTAYGAACDGTTNDTTAFNSAFSANSCVFVPPTQYGCAVNALAIPSYKTLTGVSQTEYVSVGTASRLVPASGASYIIDPSSSTYAWINGVDIYGGGYASGYPSYSSNVACIKAGATRMYVSNSGIRFCGNGGLANNTYTHDLTSLHNTWYGNGQLASLAGVNSPIDSDFIGDTFAANYHGIYLSAGSNSNRFVNPRIEWNIHDGVKCYQGLYNNFSNIQVDSNSDRGWNLDGCSGTVTGGFDRRDGSTNTYGKNTAVYFNGSNNGFTFNGVQFGHGYNDDSSGIDRPAYDFTFNASTDSNISLTNNLMATGYVTAPFYYNGRPTSAIVASNTGVDSYNTSQKLGIGTSSVTSNLTVAGNVSIGTSYTGTTAPTNGLLVQGNVGIGTTSPTTAFQVGSTPTSGNACNISSTGTMTNCTWNGVAIGSSYISGVGTMAYQNANAVAITGGSIGGTPIGSSSASSGAFTTLTASGATTLTANTSSSSTTTGTLVVTGGEGISGNLYVGGGLNVSSNSVLNNTFVGGNSSPVAFSNAAFTPVFGAYGTGGGSSAMGGQRFSANNSGAQLFLAHARGASVGTFTAVNSGDDLGSVVFDGADGTNNRDAAKLLCQSEGSISTGVVPGRCILQTANSSGTLTEAMRVNSSQQVSIGTTSASQLLNVGSTGQATIDTSGNIKTTANLTTYGTFTGPTNGLTNKFRNMAMDIWQRGTSALATSSTGAYTADGWRVKQTGAQFTCSQDTGTAGALYSLKCVGGTSNTDTVFSQRIESYVAAPLAGNVVTVQFQYKQNTGGAITPKISSCYASSTDNFTTCTSDLAATSITSCASGSWCTETYTFTASASASNGYEIDLDCNTALTAGQSCWITAADARVTTGATTGINSNIPVAELRPIFAEMTFNQRYYYRQRAATSYTNFGMGRAYSTTNGQVAFYLPTPLRAAPSSTAYSALTDLNASQTGAGNITSLSPASQYDTNNHTMMIDIGGGAAFFTLGQAVALNANNTTAAWIEWSSEL